MRKLVSGRVLYEKDKDNPRLIASITKMYTTIVAINMIQPNMFLLCLINTMQI